jgi:hypothetical protein
MVASGNLLNKASSSTGHPVIMGAIGHGFVVPDAERGSLSCMEQGNYSFAVTVTI